MSAQELSMDAVRMDLWRKIHEFQIDEADSSLTFTDRLARDNGWSLDYARRVVEEYKRFRVSGDGRGARSDTVGGCG